MEARELRIGNLTTLGKVVGIEEKCFYVTGEDGENLKNTWADIKPIPLTEEWFLKCNGYWEDIISEKDAYVIDIHDELSIGWCGYLFLIISGCIVQINDTNSIYLHQLQNLYKDLKGEELTINTNK